MGLVLGMGLDVWLGGSIGLGIGMGLDVWLGGSIGLGIGMGLDVLLGGSIGLGIGMGLDVGLGIYRDGVRAGSGCAILFEKHPPPPKKVRNYLVGKN